MYTYVGCTAKSDLKINDSFPSSLQEVNFVTETLYTHASSEYSIKHVMHMCHSPYDTIYKVHICNTKFTGMF